MKLLAAVIAALVLVPAATADTRTDKQIRTLQQQVKELTGQVTTLRKRVVAAEKKVTYVQDYATCSAAWDADAFHRTWVVTDLLIEHLTGKKHFGDQTPVDDKGSCQRIGVSRDGPFVSALILSLRR